MSKNNEYPVYNKDIPGLSKNIKLIDYFAATALQSEILVNNNLPLNMRLDAQEVCKKSWLIANIMYKERWISND